MRRTAKRKKPSTPRRFWARSAWRWKLLPFTRSPDQADATLFVSPTSPTPWPLTVTTLTRAKPTEPTRHSPSSAMSPLPWLRPQFSKDPATSQSANRHCRHGGYLHPGRSRNKDLNDLVMAVAELSAPTSTWSRAARPSGGSPGVPSVRVIWPPPVIRARAKVQLSRRRRPVLVDYPAEADAIMDASASKGLDPRRGRAAPRSDEAPSLLGQSDRSVARQDLGRRARNVP